MKYILYVILIVLGVISRVIPHAPNFTPILAIALMSGLYIKKKFIVVLPISIMLVSDLIIGSHATVFWVYLSLILISLIGQVIKNNISNIVLHSILSSVLFFIITNFGVWSLGGYGYTFAGLIMSYTMAIPFFNNTLLSTFIFSLGIYTANYIIGFYSVKYQISNL
jgi:hypothetical protein